METTVLGRTGLAVSRMGVGGGGPSQLGKRKGLSVSESAVILGKAFDAGVNFVDSSEGYGTEPIIKKALEGRDRGSVVISTKKSTRRTHVTSDMLVESLEGSLTNLGTDYIDVYNLHGIIPDDYEYLVEEVYPSLEKAKAQGKIRFIGVSEMFNEDKTHAMLQRGLADDLWDVVMVGFNILNQTAREAVFTATREKDVGVQIMFAVRKALSGPEQIRTFVNALIEEGQIDSSDIDDLEDPLGFVLGEGGAVSLPDAAYRFCRDEPGVHVVLSGTGNPEHLVENLASFKRPKLPTGTISRLKHLFRNVDSMTGQ